MINRRILAAVLLFIGAGWASAGDWPRWRGPDGDNFAKDEKGLLKQWPEGGPKLAWEMDIEGGNTHASVIIVGGRLYTMANTRSKGGAVICVDLATRKILWSGQTTGNQPANSTPTYDDGLLYAVCADGGVVCFADKDGAEVWRTHLLRDLGGSVKPNWQFAESPLVDEERLIVTPGGPDAALAALHKKTGKVIWKTSLPAEMRPKDVQAQYASVVASNAGGVRQYITLIFKLGAVGVRAEDGTFLWSYPRVNNGVANVPTPLALGDHVFVSTGYDTGAALLKLDGRSAAEEYFIPGKTFQNHHGGCAKIGDHLYAGSGHNAGNPTCIEWKTGKVLWQEKQLGKGSGAITAADGMLYFLWEDGTVGLIEARPEGYRLAGQFKLPPQRGPAWAHPVVHGGKLYLRWAAKLFCYDLKAQ